MFDVKRAENRSVASALDKVGAVARDAGNSGLARKLGHRLAGVAPSVNVLDDFRRWSGDRLMRHCAATGM